VTPQDIAGALKVSNALQSSGSVVSGNREVLVQTGTYIESAADVRQLVVAVRGPSAGERKPVFMGDVAEVEDGPDQPVKYVWFGDKTAYLSGSYRADIEKAGRQRGGCGQRRDQAASSRSREP
jgi:multidrug efflux pump subunit AcrB